MATSHRARTRAPFQWVTLVSLLAIALILPGCDLFKSHVYADIDFSAQGNSAEVTGPGFSGQEGWGRWTEGKQAELVVNLDQLPTGDIQLEMTGGAYVIGPHPKQSVEIQVNGKRVGKWIFRDGDKPDMKKTASIPAGTITSKDAVRITFDILDPAAPASLNVNNPDPRVLGLGVRRIRLVDPS